MYSSSRSSQDIERFLIQKKQLEAEVIKIQIEIQKGYSAVVVIPEIGLKKFF